ncbi:MAG TPA: glycerol-3-phosphate 1-O-acyltransferase PlsY [Burkholderiales bacterium]|nr:glycerol-3-phosphate 1-O-acyltransferase PlsY [Burkholderiales bacterium]
MSTIVLALIAYLVGSIPFAVIISRIFHLPDPRSYGSGNPGATNVLRTGRKAAAALTLLGDSAKGWFAVWVAQRFGEAEMLDIAVATAAAAVVIGHMYPAFSRFRGGKGVSTALGVFIALNYYLAAGAAATWLIIAFFFRISSLAALISALFAPFFCFLLYGMHPVTLAVSAISLLLIWRHKNNIRNLLAGKESRIGGGSP